jgi:hypothetical protein
LEVLVQYQYSTGLFFKKKEVLLDTCFQKGSAVEEWPCCLSWQNKNQTLIIGAVVFLAL